MTQANPIIGSGKTGLEYRGADNDGKQALLNHHKGGSAPSYAEAGAMWLDDSATPWKLKIYDGTDWVTLLAVNASTNAVTPYLGTTPLSMAASGVLWAVDEQASGTAPSSAAMGTWTKRTLGTEKKNTLSGASLASSVMALPAGTYEVEAFLAAHNASGSSGTTAAARLRDTTNNVTLAMGTGSGLGLSTSCLSIMKGTFTLAGTANVELQYFCQATGAPYLGYTLGSGDVETWAAVHITRRG